MSHPTLRIFSFSAPRVNPRGECECEIVLESLQRHVLVIPVKVARSFANSILVARIPAPAAKPAPATETPRHVGRPMDPVMAAQLDRVLVRMRGGEPMIHAARAEGLYPSRVANWIKRHPQAGVQP